MAEELEELRALVKQLRADNDRLRQEQATARPGPSTAASTPVLSTAFSTPSTLPQTGWSLYPRIGNVQCLEENQV